MKRAHHRKVPYIQQMRQTECGLCCVAMILQYYKSYEGIRGIRSSLEVGRDGLKISLLSNYLKQRGMETKVYQADALNIRQMPLPAIIYWKNEHFVVLEKMDCKSFSIVDPAVGRRSVSTEEFLKCYSNIIMVTQPTSSFTPVTQKRNIWKEVFHNIKVKKSLYAKLIAASSCLYALQILIPITIQQLTENITSGTGKLINGNTFYYVLGMTAVLALITFYRGIKVIDLQIDIDEHISKGTFKRMMRLPFKFFETRSNGDLLFRLNCLPVIRDIISEKLIQGILQFGLMIIMLTFMVSKSLLLTGIAVLFLLLNIIFINKMKPALMAVNQNELVEETRLQGVQVEAIYSAFGIKIAGMENDILNNWDERYSRAVSAYKKKSFVNNLNDAVLQTLQMIAPLIILAVAIFQSMVGSITIGEAIALYTLATSLFANGMSVFNVYNAFVLATSYLERISDIMDAEVEEMPDDPVSIELSGRLRLSDLKFAYTQNSEYVLKNINLEINRGEKVAIVGASGSGKSTLTKIILGLYPPTAGSVSFDGVDINDMDKYKLRRQIGIVPQDMSLFNKSIFDNICTNRIVSDDDVYEVAKIAQIDDEIIDMPMGYQTIVSDMGMNLSGGQRQRIILARALLNKPEVMILDEATSALDTLNEAKVSNYLHSIGCTRLIIAHRLSTIVDADRIVVLDKGEITEMGRHKELLSQNGIYSRLYRATDDLGLLA